MSSQTVTMRYGNLAERETASASDWVLLGSTTLSVSTTSTSAASCGTITLPSAYTSAKVIWVRIRDTAGKRTGYFYGSDCIFLNYQAANGVTSTLTYGARIIHRVTSDGIYAQYPAATTGGYGVYAYSISSAGVITFRRRYHSNYSLAIDGDFKCDVYMLTYPAVIYS